MKKLRKHYQKLPARRFKTPGFSSFSGTLYIIYDAHPKSA